MFYLFSRACKGLWSLVNFHAKSPEKSGGSSPLGSQWSTLQGMFGEKQNKKLYSVQKLTSTLPNHTQEFTTYFLGLRFLMDKGDCLPAISFAIIENVDLILLPFPWFPSMVTVIILNKALHSY